MTAYSDMYDVAVDAAHILRKQVASAIHKAAVDVTNEDPGTANHANRIIWARKVLDSNQAPVNEAEAWIWHVLTNATIQAAPSTSTDADVQFQVNSMIDTMANAGR